MKFDDKDYPDKGPTVPDGLMISGKGIGERTVKGPTRSEASSLTTRGFEVTEDGKIMTVAVHETGQPNAATYVYGTTRRAYGRGAPNVTCGGP